MEVVLKKIKESPRKIFITGITIGIMFGLIIGVMLQTHYNVLEEDRESLTHQKKMNDLDYLEKLVKIKRGIVAEPFNKKMYSTLDEIDSLFIIHLNNKLK